MEQYALPFVIGLVLGGSLIGMLYAFLMQSLKAEVDILRRREWRDGNLPNPWSTSEFKITKTTVKNAEEESPLDVPGDDDDDLTEAIKYAKKVCTEADSESKRAKDHEQRRRWLCELQWARKAIAGMEKNLESSEADLHAAVEDSNQAANVQQRAEEQVCSIENTLDEERERFEVSMDELQGKQQEIEETYEDHLCDIRSELSELSDSLRTAVHELEVVERTAAHVRR